VKKAIYFGSLPAKLSLPDRFALAKRAGLDGVEIPSDYETQEQVEAVAAAAAEAGVKIHSVMCSSHWAFPLSSTDEAVRLKACDGVRHALSVAKWADADTVLVVPGVVNEDVSYGAAYEISHKSIREIIPAAEEVGIKLGLENVWNKFLLSPLEMRDYIDSFESDLVCAYFDVGNILLYGYPHQWIEILAERICKIHIKDFNVGKRDFVPLLTGDVDWPRVMNSLRGVGYNGYITAELAQYTLFHDQMVLDTGVHLQRILDR
jgi:L-ribulose-5-phosphate 3-epimerase